MSFESAISINNVNKIYKIYENPFDRLKQSLWRNKKKYYKEFWALKDIAFEIKKGTSLGIIGRNGSGKSTLLQILCNILQPTAGDVQVNGRIAALLELGSGFNPEFTGRENVFMNAAIMGISNREIQDRFLAIEEFAEIGSFFDQPVKTYSSGMFVRLAFACAVNVDPDILIIDEALAVGDSQFQLKCIEKMKSFKKEGKTIIFVSHDTYTVKNFCDEAIWMMNGQVHRRGNVNFIIEEYEDFMKSKTIENELNEPSYDIKEGILTIDKINFIDVVGKSNTIFKFGEAINVVVEYTVHSQMEGIVGGVALYDKQYNYVCGINTKLDKKALPSQPGKYQLILKYDEMDLLPGTYFVDVAFFESSAVVALDYKNKSTSFRIDSGDYFAEGLTYIKHTWISEG